jgi:preprotein translocase subunit SecE
MDPFLDHHGHSQFCEIADSLQRVIWPTKQSNVNDLDAVIVLAKGIFTEEFRR